MTEKLNELLELKILPKIVKNSIVRRTIIPKIVDVQNTIFKDGKLVSINNDTNITVKLSPSSKYLKLGINISSAENASCQIFYKSENEDFCENNSIKLEINNSQKCFIIHDKNIDYLRIDPINVDGGSTWSTVASVGARYKLDKMSDLMIDLRWQYFFSDWVDGLDHNWRNYDKSNDWLLWLNVGYIYYLD